jgi:hypothetical protein
MGENDPKWEKMTFSTFGRKPPKWEKIQSKFSKAGGVPSFKPPGRAATGKEEQIAAAAAGAPPWTSLTSTLLLVPVSQNSSF